MSPKTRRIGYARVSTLRQDLERQLRALKRYGCDLVFSDKASGKTVAGRPDLEAALTQLDEGDEFVIAEWDRATRSMWDGLQIIKRVIESKAVIRVLDRSYIDLSTPMGQGFMALFSAMAEDERQRIIKRTHEGRQVARERGVKMGRKPKLNAKQVAEIRQRLANGEKSRDLGDSYGVSRSTIARVGA
ncbi:recombinase family protein [Rhodoplanes sp. TEM]|uniref:Recombinase family protein n=1 Tax=Rhodoplanes tepidamans TaxID=200616 RepID=A0ABT5J681_RHOTP|nr:MULTISPECIES: recombinase family protein [Rhodoplanes]MDC7785093.1 recombinase family protein [Rhodoplanes tepidamans]MDC7982567.1 recombinase family protein [Rhodoplanes sp. TEM]MDQ0356582.1 DNA invertase Pin-like site-specific DNA recombinase [Rhodoplanes tepidamans]